MIIIIKNINILLDHIMFLSFFICLVLFSSFLYLNASSKQEDLNEELLNDIVMLPVQRPNNTEN